MRLREVAVASASGDLTEQDLGRLVAEQTADLLDAATAAVFRFDPEWITTLGHRGGTVLPQQLPRDEPSIVAEVARTGRLVRETDYETISGELAASVRTTDEVRSTIGVPVFLEGSLWGAITAGAAIAEDFRADAEHALERLAELTSAALANAQTQRQLLESKAKLEAALSSMTDAVFISDEQGHFLHFNEAFTTFHRFERCEQTLKSLEDYPAILEVFMPDGFLAPLEQWAVPRALRGEVGVEVEYGLRRKDTGERWVGSYNFAPIRSAEGKIIGSVVTGRDITDQKRADAERKRTHRESKRPSGWRGWAHGHGTQQSQSNVVSACVHALRARSGQRAGHRRRAACVCES